MQAGGRRSRPVSRARDMDLNNRRQRPRSSGEATGIALPARRSKLRDDLPEVFVGGEAWRPIPALDTFELGFNGLSEQIAVLQHEVDLAVFVRVVISRAGTAAQPNLGLVPADFGQA